MGKTSIQMESNTPTVESLHKIVSNGLYARPKHITDTIIQLLQSNQSEFKQLINIEEPSDSRYIPSECLLYFLRRPPFAADRDVLRVLFTAIRQRVLKAVPVPTRHLAGQKAENSIDLDIRDAVMGKFQEICEDQKEHVERLDFFECRFNAGVARLRTTVRRDICNDAAHLAPLDYESNELHPEVEQALSCITDSFEGPETDFLYRSKINSAISSLPPDERRVVELFLQDIPIDSKEPDEMTMVKIIGCSEKTVRNRRDRAFAKLAELLKEEDA